MKKSGIIYWLGGTLTSATNRPKYPLLGVLKCRRCEFDPGVGKISWGRKWQPTLVFLPGKCYEQGSLVGYNPWDCKSCT